MSPQVRTAFALSCLRRSDSSLSRSRDRVTASYTHLREPICQRKPESLLASIPFFTLSGAAERHDRSRSLHYRPCPMKAWCQLFFYIGSMVPIVGFAPLLLASVWYRSMGLEVVRGKEPLTISRSICFAMNYLPQVSCTWSETTEGRGERVQHRTARGIHTLLASG